MKTDNRRKNYQGSHILSDDYSAETDTWKSGLNNNVLVFGPSGAGKTRHYVKPNILHSHESMIISDTKGSLFAELAPDLKKRGYEVLNINFTNLAGGVGYNPLDYIRYDEEKEHYSEKDILTISACLVNNVSERDPFWDLAARQYISCLISYVLEALPVEEHTLETVVKLLSKIVSDDFAILMEELECLKPECTAAIKYRAIKESEKADKMASSIVAIASTNMETLVFDDALDLYKREGRIDFKSIGKKKTALFLTISDTDRSLDKLAHIFITQALQALCQSADEDYDDHMLPVPVRFYLDDFAANLYIPDFDKIISVIRSREISVSVILQSITQLESLYGNACAKTIINNCDRQLYLGGQDPDTGYYIAIRMNKPLNRIMDMPLDSACLLIRGQKPYFTRKYDPDKEGVRKRTASMKTGRHKPSPEYEL